MPFQIIRNDITKVEGANKMFLFANINKKLELNQTRYFTTARKELNSILDFITEALASSGMDPKACSRTRFRSEDLTVMLMDHASEGSRLKVTVRKTWQMLLLLFVNVYLLSVAAPSVPGGILLCLTALLPQIGIPVSGVTIIIGLYFLVSLMQTMINVTSTAVCTYIVDRWEKTG